MLTAILLLSCALLSALTPDPTNISTPYAGLPPCVPGPWRVECPACSPPVVLVGVASCVGAGDGSEEVLDLLPGKLSGWRTASESNAGADLNVKEGTP